MLLRTRRHKVWWLVGTVGNEVLAAAQFSGYNNNLICSMSHRDRPPPPETYRSTFRLEITTAASAESPVRGAGYEPSIY